MVGTRTGGLWVVLMDLLTSQETASQVLQAPRAAHAVTITAPRRAALGESIDGFGCAPGERSLRTTGPARALRPGLGT